MASMLPASSRPPRSLADTGENLISQVTDPSPGAARKVAVVVIDGLGSQQLAAHSGHARFLHRHFQDSGEERYSGLPSTTASALVSITTGATPGQHGLLGYQVRDPKSGHVVNHLKPFPAGVAASTWQPVPTVFEQAAERGIPALAFCEERFRGTDFTEATLRGADLRGVEKLPDHLHQLRSFFDEVDAGFAYLYWPAVDRMGHQHGVDSDQWRDAVEAVDAFCAELAGALTPGEAVTVTADHGMLDVADAERFVFSATHPLRADVALWAGEPRCVHLYLHEGVESGRWAGMFQETLGHGFRVRTRTQLLEAGIFGAVSPENEPRIGDVVAFAEGRSSLYDEQTASSSSLAMRGQHGSFSDAEIRVPHIPLHEAGS